MKGAAVLLLAVALLACNDGEDLEATRVQIGDIAVSPPPGWEMQDWGATARVWTPAENPRRESVTVLVGPPVLGDVERAFAAAREAQGVLHDGRVTGSTRFTAPGGFPGLQLDLTFRPDTAMDQVYTRRHTVVLVDGRSVHVLYTALHPDPARAPLARVVASLRKGG